MLADNRDRQGGAIVMRQYGAPEVLHFKTLPLAALQPDEIRLRSIASAINHSDLEIRAGNWPIRRSEPFPYTPGLEVVGEVVEVGSAVADFRIGDRAITMMQGLGGVRALRPGGYAEYVVVGADAAAPVAADIDPLAMAALGLAGVTAFVGLQKIGALAGRRIAVTGAAGGVGSAAVAIAKAQGAEVIGIVSRAQHAEYVRSLGAVETMTAQDVAAGALASGSIDGLLDSVAGTAFGTYVAALRPGGALSLVGAVGGSGVSFDAFRLVEVTLTGYSTEDLDGRALRHAIDALSQWLRDGAIVAPSRTVFALRDTAAAHSALELHGVRGRVLLVPDR